MQCDRCQKREAKILYTEIINGEKKEQHLCEECATDYTSFQMGKPIINKELTLGDLLSTILDGYYSNGVTEEVDSSKSDLVCPSCGTTYEEFIQNGRFGCASCYQGFNKKLGKTLKGIQGSDVHTGKRPKGFVTTTDRILKDLTETERLALKLQEAVEKEEFEEAAKLRDQIKELKKEELRNA